MSTRLFSLSADGTSRKDLVETIDPVTLIEKIIWRCPHLIASLLTWPFVRFVVVAINYGKFFLFWLNELLSQLCELYALRMGDTPFHRWTCVVSYHHFLCDFDERVSCRLELIGKLFEYEINLFVETPQFFRILATVCL